MQRICVLADVPLVSAHGLRGTHATLATEAGLSGFAVARALGHTSVTTTYRSYATVASVASSRAERVGSALAAGGDPADNAALELESRGGQGNQGLRDVPRRSPGPRPKKGFA